MVGIHLTEQRLLDQDGIGRTDLVAAAGKIRPIQHHDIRVDPGEFLGQDSVVHLIVFIPPGHVVQVDGGQRIGAARFQSLLAVRRIDLGWMEHFFKRRA